MKTICISAAVALAALLAQTPAWSAATHNFYGSTVHGVIYHNCPLTGGGGVIHGIIIHHCHPIHGIIIWHRPIGIAPVQKVQ